ncbi:adenine/guanine phosphoribosyltransferase-like PRPP-binding protein [Catenulispora sp. EB89]
MTASAKEKLSGGVSVIITKTSAGLMPGSAASRRTSVA